MNTTNDITKPSASIGVNFKFLGFDLSAYLEVTPKAYHILISPTELKNSVSISVSELISDFNQLFKEKITEQDIAEKIGVEVCDEIMSSNSIDWSKIRFSLTKMYLDLVIPKNTSDNEIVKADYALTLQILFDDADIKIPIINASSLTLNFWNIKNANILKSMSIIDPEYM